MRWFVEIILVLAAVATILTYCGVQPNALDEIPESFQEEAAKAVETADLEIDGAKYMHEGNEAFLMFQAAKAINGSSAQNKALVKSVKKALHDKDGHPRKPTAKRRFMIQ